MVAPDVHHFPKQAILADTGRSGPPSGTTSAVRTRRVIIGTVAVGAFVFYVFFLLLVLPEDLHVAEGPLQVWHAEDDDERVGHPHLLTVRAWSQEGSPVTVTLHHRVGADGAFSALRLQRIGTGATHAAELPPLEEGQRAFYYLEVRDGRGNAATLPAQGPDGPLLHVRWEGHVAEPVLALHIALMIGSLFFLVHGLHYAVRLLGRRAAVPQVAIARKSCRAIVWGWACFFVGGIPLGIYVSGTALGWHNAWGGWPLGFDVTDTKTEVLVVYWAMVLAARADLLWPKARPWWSDRGLAWSVVAGALLTAVVYAIPHSFFFQ